MKEAGWTVIEGMEPFNFARNANLGIKACQGDVLLVNDDVEFLKPLSLQTLNSIVHRFPRQKLGILAPQVSGAVGNRKQMYGTPLHVGTFDTPDWQASHERLAFVCVYIAREVFDTIGYLDESFGGYGREDDDFCLRAQRAGFKLGITDRVIVKHGFQGLQWSSSFRRAMNDQEYAEATKKADEQFRKKWA